MATILSDDFNRANEELGASANWTERGGDFEIVSNEVFLQDNSGGGWTVAYDSGSTYSSADYTVACDTKLVTGGGGGYLGVVGRRVNYSTDDSDGYFASIRPSSGRVRLWSRVSGVATSIATTDAETINYDTFYTIKLDMNGTTIKEFIDGSEILSATSSSISAAGDGGIGLSSGSDEEYWDNFLSEDGSVAGGQPTMRRWGGSIQPIGAQRIGRGW